MFTRRATILGALLLASTVSGCGQKGPLYVRGVPADATWPYPLPAPAPAPDPAPRKTPDVPGRTDPAPAQP